MLIACRRQADGSHRLERRHRPTSSYVCYNSLNFSFTAYQYNMTNFLERLNQGHILCDGAIGTYLYTIGKLSPEVCFDELNLSNPDLVKRVHLDYISAGAEIIETNTFGANRLRLAAHGHADKTQEINEAGVALAKEARSLSGQVVWIAGSAGPLGRELAPLGPVSKTQAQEVFEQQIGYLAEAGVDLIMLETFSDLQEVREAVLAARKACGLPLVAQITFTEEGRTIHGDTPEDVVAALEALDVTLIGANCGVGPEPTLQVSEQMSRVSRTPLAVQPNAGFPSYQDGRYVYRSSPEYMAEWARQMVQAGVKLIGGCCGTTPEHIAAMRDASHEVSKVGTELSAPRPKAVAKGRPIPLIPPISLEPTGLSQNLGQKFVVTVEVDPPRGFDISDTLKHLRALRSKGLVDAFNVADSPRAQGRMSALAMCSLIQTRLGAETILHLATRHRNAVALHSELLGAHALGVRNILTVMGDIPSTGDYPSATAVSDVTASGLVSLIDAFNHGVTLSGKPIEQPTSFFVGCAFNLAATDMDRELRTLERKVKAGAHFILTQPVYDPEVVERCWQRLGGFPLPLIMGVLPLSSHRHAEFLHNEVPGIEVPQHLRDQLLEAGSGSQELGITQAKDLLKAVTNRVNGAYFIVPFQRYEVVGHVLEGLKLVEQSKKHKAG